MVIRILPPEVINQIAAGEVIERPFSIVKECMENSIDAGATRVELELEEGGKSLVRIRDDGRGMSPEDLELAFVSHATSKLSSLADLDAIVSLGFRGEALASIGSVARVRISRVPRARMPARRCVRMGGGFRRWLRRRHRPAR
jgi:DNA mismatch repair protein MutL